MIELPKPELHLVFRRLRDIALQEGISTRDIAEQLDIQPTSNVSRWVSGSSGRRPPLEVVRWLADQLGRSLVMTGDSFMIIPKVTASVLASYDGISPGDLPPMPQEDPGEPETEDLSGLGADERFVRRVTLKLPDPGRRGCLVNASVPQVWSAVASERWKVPKRAPKAGTCGAAIFSTEGPTLKSAADLGYEAVEVQGNVYCICRLSEVFSEVAEPWWTARKPRAVFVSVENEGPDPEALVWWTKGHTSLMNEFRLLFI